VTLDEILNYLAESIGFMPVSVTLQPLETKILMEYISNIETEKAVLRDTIQALQDTLDYHICHLYISLSKSFCPPILNLSFPVITLACCLMLCSLSSIVSLILCNLLLSILIPAF